MSDAPRIAPELADLPHVPVTALEPLQGNLKELTKREYAKLKKSITDYGLIVPFFVWQEAGKLLDGHQRQRVMLQEGWELDVPVVYISAADEQDAKRKLLVVSSQYGRVSQEGWDDFTWDIDDGWLQDTVHFDALSLVFGDWEPDPEQPAGADAEPQVNRAEELREEWGTEPGQLWRLPSRADGREHRLICGDCTDAAVVERVMGGERAALAWFDPPFGIDLQPQRQKTQAITNDGKAEAQALWERFLPLLADRMNPDTSLFLCQDWSEFDWTLPLVRRYFTIKSKVVWNKNVWGIGYYTRPKHEDILYCWKGNPPTIKEPVPDVWDVPRESAPEHAAEKPPELSGKAILHFCTDGDVVIDWFVGLGGSIIACENLSRQCRAVEISPAYVAVALQRYLDAFGIRPVLIQ